MRGHVALIESSYDTPGNEFETAPVVEFSALPEIGKRFAFQAVDGSLRMGRTGTVRGLRRMSETEIRFRTRRSMYAMTEISS